jgi:mannosyl-3-phosphoglycerate phosphatase
MLQKVVFTDIDGTLTNIFSGKYEGTDKMVSILKANNIPVILCSAKTRSEQNKIRNDLGLTADPFIVENGGAIIIPNNYFDLSSACFDKTKQEEEYIIIELAKSAKEVRTKLSEIKNKFKIEFKGVADVPMEELSKLATMPIDYTKRMAQREYGETILQIKKEDMSLFTKIVDNMGLKVIHGGRFLDITSGNDKGNAVNILVNLFRKKYHNQVVFFGVGDSANDVPMLKHMEVPMLVQRSDGSWQDLEIKNIVKLKGIGPEGWKSAFNKIMDRIN